MFTRQSDAPLTEVASTIVIDDLHDGTAPVLPNVAEIDARGLEPPQPMVKILETLATLPTGAELHARTDRRPMHLYP